MTHIELENGFYLKTGYQSGLVGWIATMHGTSYIEKWNFGKFFECKVATQASSFMESYNPSHSQIWSLVKDNKFYGSITLDGSPSELDQKGAHLRWFILDENTRGQGFGKLLLQSAIDFAKEKNFPSLYLWTLEGLEPAGGLYRRLNFQLEENLLAEQWGQKVQEEKLRLTF